MSSTKNYRNTTSLVTQGLERDVGKEKFLFTGLFYARDASVKTVNKTTLTPSFKGVVQTHLTDDFNFSDA